jgi:hypothetical protein
VLEHDDASQPPESALGRGDMLGGVQGLSVLSDQPEA